MTAELAYWCWHLGLFAGGALAGLLSRWAPLSGWVALALPLLLPPLGMALMVQFC